MDIGDEQPALNITPSFKSRASKGKDKDRSRRVAVLNDEDNSVNNDSSSVRDTSINNDDPDSSAVIFKISASKSRNRNNALGGSTSSSTSSAKKQQQQPGTASASRSRLALSFDAEDVNEPADTSTRDGEAQDDPDDSVSYVKRSAATASGGLKKNKRPGMPSGGLGSSSSVSRAAEKALSNSLSAASISSLANKIAASPAQSSAGPSYSRDYLDQLKAANVAAPRPAGNNPNDSYAEPQAYEDDEYPTMYDDEDAQTTSLMAPGQPSTSSSILPTESTINAAKARRETARRLGQYGLGTNDEEDSGRGIRSQSDFISLDVGMPNSGNTRESRLVREEDEDELGEGDEAYAAYTGAEERIALGKKGRKDIAKKRKEEMRALIEGGQDGDADDFIVAGGGKMNDDDEEDREWEMEQIRRGGEQNRRRGGDGLDDDREPYRPAPIPEQVALPTLHGASKRLKTALDELNIQHEQDTTNLNHSNAELSSLEAQEAELKIQVESINSKFEFFTEFKSYIEDVAGFLSAKFGELEKMERDNEAFQRERTQGIVGSRRHRDDTDDLALFTGVPVKAIDEKSEQQEENWNMDENAEVDDMGRSRREDDVAPKSLARRTRRLERQKRRVTLQGSSDSARNDDAEGFESDDELLSSDAQDLRSASQALEDARNTLFADVESEEFRDPNKGVKLKFLEWRTKYPEDYRDAFAGLSLVQTWEFWTRVEMASWNPLGIKELQPSPASLDAYNWHASLTAYQDEVEQIAASQPQTGPTPSGGGDTENESVVNGTVATVILPRLRKLAIEAYDPFSRTMTSKALHVVEEISYCVETNNQRFEHLVQGFLVPLQRAIRQFQHIQAQCVRDIAHPSIALDMDAIQARSRYLQRQLKLLTNAVRWRRYAKDIPLSRIQEGASASGGSDAQGDEEINMPGAGTSLDACLANELVTKCMLPVVEASWDTGGKEVAQRVGGVIARLEEYNSQVAAFQPRWRIDFEASECEEARTSEQGQSS